MISETLIALRLLIAAFLGGFVGLERESHKHPAGFRTHILVCVGSTLVMLISVYGFSDVGALGKWDPARLAAQVVSGIGFLGAGTILKEGPTVKGLTTAASLWVVSAIGLAVGAGFYFAAIIGTLIVVISLVFLDKIEHKLISHRRAKIVLKIADRPGQLGIIGNILGKHGHSIKTVDILPSEHEGESWVYLTLAAENNIPLIDLIGELSKSDGIFQARFES